MTINEALIEAAALRWFQALGYAVLPGFQLAPGEPAAELDSLSDVVLVGQFREATDQLKLVISSRALPTFGDTLLPKALRGRARASNSG